MPKNLDLTENLEKYIINHSENLHPIQKELLILCFVVTTPNIFLLG